MKYKIGDMVIIREGFRKGEKVKIGRINKCTNVGYIIAGGDLYWEEEFCEQVKNTRLARKLYPKHTVSDCKEFIYV